MRLTIEVDARSRHGVGHRRSGLTIKKADFAALPVFYGTNPSEKHESEVPK